MSDGVQAYAKEIDEIIRHHFGLEPKSDVVRFEFILRSDNPEGYDRVRSIHVNELASRPDKAEVEKRVFFGDEFAVFLECSFPISETSGIPGDLSFHYPICTLDEIARIHRPVDSWDSLLRIRADAISDSPRLTRVFLSRRARNPSGWSLTSHFDRGPIDDYLRLLSEDDRAACAATAAGMGFLREPNGVCMRTDLGDVLVISESLGAFLYYMNAFLFHGQDLPERDAMSCLMIAVRTMFMTEALDFDLDPRGDLPQAVHDSCLSLADAQMQFVVGHEFAHHLLGHLDAKVLTAVPYGVMPFDKPAVDLRYYSPRQKQEFEADAGALLHVKDDVGAVARILNGAICFFLCLEVFYAISDYANPGVRAPVTHPGPVDRIWALRKAVLANGIVAEGDTYSDHEMRQMIDDVQVLKATLLREFVPFNVENMEFYGSIYLPSFRKTELFDRIDF